MGRVEAAQGRAVGLDQRQVLARRVELEVEGTKEQIALLIEDAKTGPPASRVIAVDVEWSSATGRFSDFQVWY